MPKQYMVDHLAIFGVHERLVAAERKAPICEHLLFVLLKRSSVYLNKLIALLYLFLVMNILGQRQP